MIHKYTFYYHPTWTNVTQTVLTIVSYDDHLTDGYPAPVRWVRFFYVHISGGDVPYVAVPHTARGYGRVGEFAGFNRISKRI